MTFITESFYNKISGRSLELYTNRFEQYASVVANQVSSQVEYLKTIHPNGRLEATLHHVVVQPHECRCVGFIDDTSIVTCRPGESMQESGEITEDIQRAFYSGFIRRHGLKAQTIFLPDGMVGSVWIASLRNNDNGMFNMSNMGDYLLEVLPTMPNCGPDRNVHYALYCDMIFQNHHCLFNCPKKLQDPHEIAVLNRFDSTRVSIKMMYRRFKTLFPIFSGGKSL